MSFAARRGLSPELISALLSGELSPILERVRADRTLCLEIREDYLNVYYRGGSLLKLLKTGPSIYRFDFNRNYFAPSDVNALPTITDPATWVRAVPTLKEAMDLRFGRLAKDEREIQQHLLRDNNFSGVSTSTDYFICDIEYNSSEHGQFDAVGVHWPSSGEERKCANNRRLVIAEVKQGDGALEGSSGLHAHIQKINKCLSSPKNVEAIKQEMITVFNQKRMLGLVDCRKDLVSFSDERPLLVLVLVNHDPAKTALRRLLQTLPDSPHAELRIALSSFMGYGLYDQGIISIDDAMTKYADLVGEGATC